MTIIIRSATISFWMALCLAIQICCAVADSGNNAASRIAAIRQSDPSYSEDHSWTLQPWTGDEKSLKAARTLVDAKAKSPGFDVYVSKAAAACSGGPRNTLAAFLCLYSAWELESCSGKSSDPTKSVWSISNYAGLDDTYDGARIRFLYESVDAWAPRNDLTELGRRLLKYNPNDCDVMTQLAALYGCEISVGSGKHKDEAIRLCLRASAIDPTYPFPVRRLSVIYSDACLYCDGWNYYSGRKLTPAAENDLRLSLKYLQKTIKMVALNDPWQVRLAADLHAQESALAKYSAH